MAYQSDYLHVSVMTCNGTALRQAARHVSRFYDKHLAKVGLRSTQYVVLLVLFRFGPSKMVDLADTLVMDRSSLGHLLRPLERDGLVLLTTGDPDRRQRIVSLTPSGSALTARAETVWGEAQAEFENFFGSDRAREMREVLASVTDLPLE